MEGGFGRSRRNNQEINTSELNFKGKLKFLLT